MPLYYRHKKDVKAILILFGIIFVVSLLGIVVVRILGY